MEKHIGGIESERQHREQLAAESSEQKLDSKEHKNKAPEQAKESIDSIRHKIEHTAAKASEIKVDDSEQSEDKHPQYVNRGLKTEALHRTLNRTRKHLSKPQRALSRAVHQPTIDVISQVGAQTIARPTGLLTGSIIALAGSSYLLYSAKHYGYQYNYLAVVLLFVGGYLAGLVIELLAHFLHHRSK